MGCIFCKMVNKELEHHIVAEDEHFLAFLSLFPNTLGTTVVIPKKHYSSYAFDLDEHVMYELVKFSKHVAKKLDHFFDDVGRTAMVFEGFGVDHVHAKLFPMHGTAQTQQQWQAINSSIDHYFEQYPGYISTHDAAQANHTDLASLAKEIRAKNT
ncbi:HIT family protein [Acinetobacter boissieri]|uniref:Diadenosine tetraphosphate (Ap4A) hydrolase n=1 Tax=Acinetobacter boissieri TaxID=1219383 RepID=A0A1G6J5W4_9GAMM|nr:HIT family protein [Acinetobacter boissieri]SDC14047.1 Diadenosine tetraphosphate (Ap4A) hydrolase [Acinetobacter boissieri]